MKSFFKNVTVLNVNVPVLSAHVLMTRLNHLELIF